MAPDDIKQWAELLGLAPGVVVIGYFLARESRKLVVRLIDALYAIAEALGARTRE